MDDLSTAMKRPDFVWGVSTSAYQIEGAHDADGRTPSIWDVFSHTPGKIENNDHGDVACDHYHLWKKDLDLLAGLGVQAYRFSVSWSRFLSNGIRRNPKGIDFYNRLVDGLLERNIKPYLTLYHWDLPVEFYDRGGGWLNPDTASRFADYAAEVTRELGDRVATIATFNEPLVAMSDGYACGHHAPGHRSLEESCRVAHQLLRAHGLGLRAIRAIRPDLPAGIVLNMNECVAASQDPADLAALRRYYAHHNEIFAHPLFFGRHSENLSDFYQKHLPPIGPEDAKLFSQRIDFLGINYYMRLRIRASDSLPNLADVPPAELPVTDMGWEIYPEGLESLLVWVHRTYRPPSLLITENGAGLHEQWDGKSKVFSDPRRVDYLRRHVQAAWSARTRHGVPLDGYFAWSFLDNFEWAWGYKKRFGLVYVDYPTQARIPKESYGFWRDLSTGRLDPASL